MDGTSSELDQQITDRADLILQNTGLSWDEIEGKDVLDVGSGSSELAKAATLTSSTAKISSIDIETENNWLHFPWGETQEAPIQADAERMPFKDSIFDYVIIHASTTSAIPEAVRVLRPGGELRIYPIAGIELEYWYISYYLDNVKQLPHEQIQEMMTSYDHQIEQSEGWLPDEYVTLREEALNHLTSDQKLHVIDAMAQRYEQIFNLQFTYEVNDPEARKPNARLIYKKSI